jgi:hypothetical protein
MLSFATVIPISVIGIYEFFRHSTTRRAMVVSRNQWPRGVNQSALKIMIGRVIITSLIISDIAATTVTEIITEMITG